MHSLDDIEHLPLSSRRRACQSKSAYQFWIYHLFRSLQFSCPDIYFGSRGPEAEDNLDF